MSESNKVVQGLWVRGQLSVMERLCIRSFLENGHEFHLYIYDNITEAPPGTILLDGNEIIPKGGWWVDMDTICLKHFDIEA